MIDELDWVKSLRPPADPPTAQARAAALGRLQRAIESEGSDHASARRRSRVLALLVPVLAAALTVVIGGAALLLLRHTASGPGASSAPGYRGRILDQSGGMLALDRTVYALQITLRELPSSSQAGASELRLLTSALRLSRRPASCPVPGGPTRRLTAIECQVARGRAQGAGSVTIGIGVSSRVRMLVDTHRRELVGVSITRRYVRTYPFGTLAPQLLGTVGPITQPETQDPQYTGVSDGAIVGQSGLEYEYDSYLRAGDDVRLSLDFGLQAAGQAALSRASRANPPASGGAFVAMNPENGAVYAMGSLPSRGSALINRAIQSAGPVGSTFTPVTALAALQSGAWAAGDSYDDTGEFCTNGQCRHNSGHATYGVLDLENALRVEDNVFFSNLGALTNNDAPHGGALQTWAELLGLGRTTEVDLPNEMPGTLPTPIPEQPWTVGDNINLAVGQGDLQVTPLQLAIVYAAIANGGTIVTPHVGQDIQSQNGTILDEIDPGPRRHLKISPVNLKIIRDGLRAAASQPGGSSADVMSNFPEPVYGAVGTAPFFNKGRLADDAWYAAYVPATATGKPIVVVVTVQQGGLGAVTAAPIARQVLSQWFLGTPGPYRPGSSTAQ